VFVTVLMPCLNEARTLAACIEQAHAGCQAALDQRIHSPGKVSHVGSTGRDATHSDAAPGKAPGLTYEILIADNGSTDGSPEIAIANDARVVHVEKKGYGAALLGGIAAARGKLRMGEIPIHLHPDSRLGPPHLRSFRDGMRHLWLVLRAYPGNISHL
jgi:cellulose synthase/poly-beta-1,6-N-acetylglucosamine synthase-like glycosyltransferase